jgi:multidrug transporter EmrE-like cation transporter
MNKKNCLKSSPKFFKPKTTIIFFTLVVLFFILAPPVLAQLDTGLDYGTYTGLGTQDIRVTIMRVVRVIIGLVGIIAIIIIIYGGYTWMTSGGNPEKIDKAKKILTNAVIGLVIILSAFAIVSFIIGALERGLGITGLPPGVPPPSACDNCSHLGSGIIESVYPAPFTRDVARNTNIMVTFKVAMDPDTIIDAGGNLITDHVKIYQYGQGEDGPTKLTDVAASATGDDQTFTFNPADYLGDGTNHIWYAVRLTADIERATGESAFPGANGYFEWRFEVGTFLDLDPVEVSNVFPEPDNQGDFYTTTVAEQSIGSVTVIGLPQVEIEASVTDLRTIVGPNASISGNYGADFTGTITVTVNPAGDTATVFWVTGSPNNNSSADITTANTIILGGGLTLFLDSDPGPGNQWEIDVVAAEDADTLRVDTRLYTFVESGASGNQINVGVTQAETAENIANKIEGDNLAVTVEPAYVSGLRIINLTAITAGNQGDNIVLDASGNWVTISGMSGGEDASFIPIPRGAPDKARNATIVIDFNEAVDPIQVTAGGAITVQYYDGTSWVTIPDNDVSYLVSNQYRTVEILSNTPCLDPNTGLPIVNSCGEEVFCWPYIDPDPTHYQVIVEAGLLKGCLNDDECTDSNFSFCVDTPGGDTRSVCNSEGDGSGYFYPEADTPAEGIIDAANNSFNGNRNTYILSNQVFGQADGPADQSGNPEYDLNNPVAETQGDDLIWSFYINKDVDLTPPVVTEIGPSVSATAVSLTDPIEVTFDEVMMSSSLKPGTGYQDGLCLCDEDNPSCPGDQTCDTGAERCESDSGSQQYCAQDTECPSNQCINKKYMTLIDYSTLPVGWWISKENLDTILPLDTYADQTKGLINHTKFSEVTNYGSEIGSGVKDVYQNCYLPSEGPISDTCDPLSGIGCCGVLESQPYCCNGRALDQTGWRTSECFTSF